MVEFVYNKDKNTSTVYIPFKITYGYYPRNIFEDVVDPYSRSHSANKLTKELRELMIIC